MKKVKSELNFSNFFYRAYADDLVIICNHLNIPKTIKTLTKYSKQYNLKFNAKKSNWQKIMEHNGRNHCKSRLRERH